jgi:hypothetical protein
VDGSISGGSPDDDSRHFGIPAAAAADVVTVRVEATLCFPFMTALALF